MLICHVYLSLHGVAGNDNDDLPISKILSFFSFFFLGIYVCVFLSCPFFAECGSDWVGLYGGGGNDGGSVEVEIVEATLLLFENLKAKQRQHLLYFFSFNYLLHCLFLSLNFEYSCRSVFRCKL